MMRKKFYSVQDVASLVLRDPETVRNYIRDKKLKAKRIGGAYFIADKNLKEFLGDDIYSGIIDTLPVSEQPEGGGK